MKTPASPATDRGAPRSRRVGRAIGLAALALGLSLYACKRVPDAATVEEVREIAADAPDDCLVVVWDRAPGSDRAFDRAHDRVEGGAISCATTTSASQFEAALRTIRESVERGDRAALLAELDVPMLYIDENGETRKLADARALESGYDEIFDERTLSMLRRLSLDNITVVPNRGAYLDYGSIWLVVPEAGAKPRIVTINHQAAKEAAEAAKRTADAAVAAGDTQ